MFGLRPSWARLLAGSACVAACTTVNVPSNGGGSDGDDDCDIGQERCACTEGGGCNEGLVCRSGLCVEDGAAGAAGLEHDSSGGRADRDPTDAGADSAPPDSGAVGGAGGGGGAAGATAEGIGGSMEPTRPADCLATGEGDPIEGDFYVEPSVGDWPDCVSACPSRYVRQPFDVVLPDADGGGAVEVAGVRYDGLLGLLDDDDHSPYEADRDLMRVLVPAGTAVEITVDPAGPESCLDPYLTTLDPWLDEPAYGMMTVNDDRAEGDRAARTTLAAPTDQPREWFVLVEDSRAFSGEYQVGGSTYDYVLRFRTFGPTVPQELVLTDGVADWSGALDEAGDIHYYSFVDASHLSYLVRLTASNPQFCAHTWQIDPEAAMSWVSSGVTAEAPCSSVVEWTTNPLIYDPDSDRYVFVVTDASGLGSNSGLGEFTYDLRVSRLN